MKKLNIIISTLLIGILLSCSNKQSEHLIFDQLSYYQPDGFIDSVLVGTYEVFENRDESTGRKIPLFVAVTPALKRDSLKEPIFIVDGGPGVAASNQAYFYTEEDDSFRKYHDIVYIDVRGTGRSGPLHCIDIQTKASPREHFQHPYPKKELTSCIEAYKDSVDFNFYATKYIVEDIEDVRQWLGYDKINIFGTSFGGKVSLMYMDNYPDAINRVVLHAPDAPNIGYTANRGKWSQQALQKVFDYCLTDSLCRENFPDIVREFESLKSRLLSDSVKAEIIFNDSTLSIEIPWLPIAAKISSYLYADYSYTRLPFLIHQAYLENYTPLLETFSLDDTTTNHFYADGMFLSNICAEEIPFQEPDSIEYKSFLSDYIYRTRMEACEVWPVDAVDKTAYMPVESIIPTLIISGGFDPTFSVETGREIASKFPNSKHVIIPYMGHVLGDLSNLECYDQNVLRYFSGEKLDLECFNEMKPLKFLVSQE
jgi:pimeloyl-ACP methyl ester carboxylesterase